MKSLQEIKDEIRLHTKSTKSIIKLLGRIELNNIKSTKLYNEMGKKFMNNGRNKIIKYSYEKIISLQKEK